MGVSRRPWTTLCLAAILIAGTASTQAQEAETAAERDARQAELEAVEGDIALTQERLAELRAEIDALDKDRATLSASLIETSQRVRVLETQLQETERRIAALSQNENALRASLIERREVLIEVLAALQRIGHRPPPAMLVRPEDALSSVRSAILLGAVVPDLREAADQLAADLRQLLSLRAEMERERDRLRADATVLAEERTRVQLLVEQRKNEYTRSVAALADEEERAEALAEQATSLKDLISRMEMEIEAAAKAKAEAEAAAEKNRERAEAERNRRPPTSLGNADRLAPAVSFADAKGLLPLPASGRIVRDFGADDGLGGQSAGISIATRPGGQVSSPADGWVVYAGPFRSYGQLLIINAGDGYHVLLAGMDQIDVQLGQFVLAGEPVATMASPKLASADPADIVSTQPVLYIEFRKDGASIDPAPWWAASSDEKVGG
ncbi:MAG TPA: peptidoglycan DD-metalloendopeptidase family protein [Bauldia sp.]|nr:peptidoglycan DD-metalloendopeptidase family protein [Bauldia sp.]